MYQMLLVSIFNCYHGRIGHGLATTWDR